MSSNTFAHGYMQDRGCRLHTHTNKPNTPVKCWGRVLGRHDDTHSRCLEPQSCITTNDDVFYLFFQKQKMINHKNVLTMKEGPDALPVLFSPPPPDVGWPAAVGRRPAETVRRASRGGACHLRAQVTYWREPQVLPSCEKQTIRAQGTAEKQQQSPQSSFVLV